MRKIFLMPLALILATCFVACVSNKSGTAHNARTGLKWEGLYSGTIPQADGAGIEVEITLNSDQTFQLRYHYIDKSEKDDLNISGLFIWDDAKDIIILNTFATGGPLRASVPPFYKVIRNQLLQLDLDGNEITGDLATLYALKKQPEPIITASR